MFEYKGYEIGQDSHNIILKPLNSFKEAEYFSTFEGALYELQNKLLLKRVSEGGKKDFENIIISLREVKKEFSKLLRGVSSEDKPIIPKEITDGK